MQEGHAFDYLKTIALGQLDTFTPFLIKNNIVSIGAGRINESTISNSTMTLETRPASRSYSGGYDKVMMVSTYQVNLSAVDCDKMTANCFQAMIKINQEKELTLPKMEQVCTVMVECRDEIKKMMQKYPKFNSALSGLLLTCLVKLWSRAGKFQGHFYGTLTEFIETHRKMFDDSYGYKLYLVSVFAQTYSIIQKGFDQAIRFTPKLVHYLTILEKNAIKISQPEFKLIQILFRIGSLFFSFLRSPRQPAHLSAFINNKQCSLIGKTAQMSVNEKLQSEFCAVSSKYCIIDPDYHVVYMHQIAELVNKDLFTLYVVKMFEVVTLFMKNQQFPDYQRLVLEKLIEVKRLISQHNNKKYDNYYTKMLEMFLNCCRAEFSLQKNQALINLQHNQESKILLFSIFYKIFESSQELPTSVANKLIEWNVSVGMMKCFPQNIEKKLIKKLSKITVNQLCVSESEIADSLLMKLVQNQLKGFIDSKHENKPVLTAQFFSTHQKIYQIYCKVAINFLTAIELDKFKSSPCGFIALVHSSEVVKKIREQALDIVFKNAHENAIYQIKFIESYLFLCSIMQSVQATSLSSEQTLDFIIVSLRENINSKTAPNFIKYLLPLFKIYKNSLLLFCLLCTCLILIKQEPQSELALQTLAQACKIIDRDLFTRFCSYHIENVKLLLLLGIAGRPEIKQKSTYILKIWSCHYRTGDIDLLLYRFDEKNYKRYTQKLGLAGLTQSKKQLIMGTLNLLQTFVHESETFQKGILGTYLQQQHNFVNFIPIRHAYHISNLFIMFEMLVNFKNCCNSCIEIYGSPKDESLSSMQKHKIIFKNKKIVLYNRITKEKEGTIEQSPEEPFSEHLFVTIEIINSKLIVKVNGKLLSIREYKYMADNLKLQLLGDCIVRKIKWKRSQNQFRTLEFCELFQVYPSEAQIKISKKSCYTLTKIQKRINVIYFCNYLQQLLKFNASELNLNQFYDKCFQLLCDMRSRNEQSKQYSEIELSCIRSLFSNILASVDKLTKVGIPNLKSIKCGLDTWKFYQMMLCGIANQKFLRQATPETKVKFATYLEILLFEKSDFRIMIENKETKIFVLLVKFAQESSEQILSVYSSLIKKIVLSHEANIFLLQKVSYLLCLASNKNKKNIEGIFNDLLHEILKVLITDKTEQNLHVQMVGKYILSENIHMEFIFLSAPKEIKQKLISYMIEDIELSRKCYGMFNDMSPEEVGELSDWMIVYAKKFLFDFFKLNKRTLHVLQNGVFLMKQISKLHQVLTDSKDNFEEIINILRDFIRYIKQVVGLDSFPTEFKTLMQQFFLYNHFNRIISSTLQKYHTQKQLLQAQIKMANSFFDLLFYQLPKTIIIRFLTQLRKQMNYIECCKYICEYFGNEDCVIKLPVYALGILLQYFIEVLVVAEEDRLSFEEREQVGDKINQVLDRIRKTFVDVKAMEYPLIYPYPKLHKQIDFNDTKSLQQLVAKVQKLDIYELKGGVYLKFVILMMQLVYTLQKNDLTAYLKYITGEICPDQKIQHVHLALNDFNQIKKDYKIRSSIDMALKKASNSHINYFNKVEKKQWEQEVKKGQVSKEDDLTPFFVDFVFMKTFYHLEYNCANSLDEERSLILKKYSQLTIKLLKSNEYIKNQLNEVNVDSTNRFETLRSIQKLSKSKKQLMRSEIINSPVSRRYLEENVSQNLGFIQVEEHFQADFLQTPKKQSVRRRKSIGEEIMQELVGKTKKKQQLFQMLESNYLEWSEEAKNKQLHRYFRDEVKEILFHQLLHRHYVVFSSTNFEQQPSKKKRFIDFIFRQEELINKELRVEEVSLKFKSNQIKKVYGFTTNITPQMKLKCNSLQNGSFPFVNQLKNKKKSNNLLVRDQQMNPDLIYTLLASQQHETSGENIEEQINQFDYTIVNKQELEQDLQKQFENICEVTERKGVYFCEWALDKDKIVFKTKQQKKLQIRDKKAEEMIKFGSPLPNIITGELKTIELKVNDILEIFYRKYNQIRNNSLEFFLKNGSSIYAIFYHRQRVQTFLQKCRNHFKKSPNFKLIRLIEDYQAQFQAQNYTEKWVAGQISNFDYLMLINKYSGRSFCDMNQYYVFPWILEDYISGQLDPSNPKIYRDLKKPIGALREDKKSRYTQRFSSQSCDIKDRYYYGSHYSTSLFIYYYLVRLEPFTSLHKDMQSGCFDSPDRLFSSMKQMWQCLLSQSSTTDIKEAIPEFYYFPTFLKNINGLDLGRKQTGEQVNDVEMPPWAKSAVDFVHKMRICLESDYVSCNLNYWIDLIFGKDQKSIQKFNVFHPLSYVENVDPNRDQLKQNLDAIMTQITFFGQNPLVLFSKQHPKKQLKNFKSLNLTDITQLQAKDTIVEIQNLDMIHYVSDMMQKRTANKKTFMLYISSISRAANPLVIELDMQNTIHTLIRIIQKLEVPTLKRLMSENFILLAGRNFCVEREIHENEVQLKIQMNSQYEYLKSLKLDYSFSGMQYNETVFAVYGSSGLRIYEWTQQLVWQYPITEGEVTKCYLEYGLIFFTISTGRLLCYDFGCHEVKQLYRYPKPSCCLEMMVHPENKRPKKTNSYNNESSYKFVLVADRRKIVLLQYQHKFNKICVKY